MGKVFNKSDIVINVSAIKDINFLCEVIAHETEHIILSELFTDEISYQYDNIYQFKV